MADSDSKLTMQLCGALLSNISFISLDACSVSTLGGNLKESFRLRFGSNTFPAVLLSGNPSAPVTLKIGLQVLSNIISYGEREGE